MELEITWERVLRIWWSYVWRNLICIVVAMIVGMAVGFIVGFIMGAIGFSLPLIRLVTGSIGFVMGLAISVVPMKLILGKDFGDFRLVLLARLDKSQASPLQPVNIQ